MIFFNAVEIVVKERTNVKKKWYVLVLFEYLIIVLLNVDVLTGTAPSTPTIHFHPQTFTVKKNNVLCVQGSD